MVATRNWQHGYPALSYRRHLPTTSAYPDARGDKIVVDFMKEIESAIAIALSEFEATVKAEAQSSVSGI